MCRGMTLKTMERYIDDGIETLVDSTHVLRPYLSRLVGLHDLDRILSNSLRLVPTVVHPHQYHQMPLQGRRLCPHVSLKLLGDVGVH